MLKTIVAVFAILAVSVSIAGASEPTFEDWYSVTRLTQWEPLELYLTATRDYAWWTFPVTATFEHERTGTRIELDGYWDGGREWRIRFAAPLPGVWTWRTSSSDAGIDGRTGRVESRPPDKTQIAANPNYRGHLGISANGRYLQYADETPIFLLADTLWAGNTARCGLDGPFFQYLEDRKNKGYNTILIKYLHGFGDVVDGPTGDRNEGGHAFVDRQFEQLNAKYFQSLDRRLEALWSRGFVAAVPTAWWGKTKKCVFDLQQAKRISAYCAVRYGAFNAVWCLSGEYQYAFRDCGWTPEQFDELGQVVQAHNPYRHPLSIHPSGRTDWDPPHNCQSSRPFHGNSWLDHHWLQTGQSHDRMYNIVIRAAENRALTPTMPVFCSEACYDQADDPHQAYHARWQVWTAFLSGCAGYGHGVHGIWQFYDPADPQGETGKKSKSCLPWREALQSQGSTMIKPVRSLTEKYPWWRLEPRRDLLIVNGKPNAAPTKADITPPHHATIPGELHIVYIPRGNGDASLAIRDLGEGNYTAYWYDPRTGRFIDLAQPAAGPTWAIPERLAPTDEDWVLVLAFCKK